MAAKKKSPGSNDKPLSRRVKSNTQTDRYEITFFKGRRKATKDEVRAEIKKRFDSIDPAELRKEDRDYYNKVKGGRARSAQSIRIDGKFVNEGWVEKNGLKELAEKMGYKSPKELLKNDPDIYQQAKDLYNNPNGLKFKYSSETVIKALDTFKGRIFINKIETPKLKALKMVDDVDKAIKRAFGSFYNEFWMSYKGGGAELHLILPDLKTIKKGELEPFLESLPPDSIIIGYIPDTDDDDEDEDGEKKQKKKKATKHEQKAKRFVYAYTVLYRGQRKSGRIKAWDKADAIYLLGVKFPKCTIIKCVRTKK